MAEPLSVADPLAIIRRRMAAQRLVGDPFATAAEAVAWSGGVQAQEYAEALWSIGMRVRDATAADVEAACDRDEILRTHVMRPTWHFVAAADLRWLLRLTAPRIRPRTPGATASSGSTRTRCAAATRPSPRRWPMASRASAGSSTPRSWPRGSPPRASGSPTWCCTPSSKP